MQNSTSGCEWGIWSSDTDGSCKYTYWIIIHGQPKMSSAPNSHLKNYYITYRQIPWNWAAYLKNIPCHSFNGAGHLQSTLLYTLFHSRQTIFTGSEVCRDVLSRCKTQVSCSTFSLSCQTWYCKLKDKMFHWMFWCNNYKT